MHPRVATYFDSLDDDLKAVAFEARDVIIELAPGIEECWKWGLAFYTYYGSLCYFNRSKKGIYIGLYYGPELQDHFGVLSGEKLKAVRHLELIPFTEEKRDALKDLLFQVMDKNKLKRG